MFRRTNDSGISPAALNDQVQYMRRRFPAMELRVAELEREAKETKETLLRVSESASESYAEITIHLLEHKLRRSPLYRLRKLDERWLHT